MSITQEQHVDEARIYLKAALQHVMKIDAPTRTIQSDISAALQGLRKAEQWLKDKGWI